MNYWKARNPKIKDAPLTNLTVLGLNVKKNPTHLLVNQLAEGYFVLVLKVKEGHCFITIN